MYQEFLNTIQSSIVSLSSDELKELLNDDDKLELKVDEALVALESQKGFLLSENRAKAEENITKEPTLIESRGKINDLLEEGKTLCVSIQEKINQVKEKSGNVNKETALALLQTAAAESKEESDKLVEDFKEKEINVDTFLERFLASRKTYHMREFKADKMSELIQEEKQKQGLANRNPSQYSNFPGFFPQPNPNFSSVPYPVGPTPMPGHSRPY